MQENRRKMPKKRRKTRKKFPKLLKTGEYCVIIGVQGDVYEYVTNSPVVKKKVVKMSFPQLRDGGCFMCKASEVGKIVVNKCLENDIFINTQKLQKLLTLMQVECIKKSGFPLFLEDIREWDCGVAIKEVDEDFRPQGRVFKETLPINIVLLNTEEEYIDNIIDKYGSLSAEEINELPIVQEVLSLGEKKDGEQVNHITSEKLKNKFGV